MCVCVCARARTRCGLLFKPTDKDLLNDFINRKVPLFWWWWGSYLLPGKKLLYSKPWHYFLRLLVCSNRLISLVGRVFTNGPGDLGSIPGRVIPKTFKMVLDTSLLNTYQYKVRIKGKVEQSRKGVAPSPTPQCSSY